MQTTSIALLLASILASCEPMPAFAFNLEEERLANIVWRVEGGSKTRWPYGVQSVRVAGVLEAREITLRSIRNHRNRHAAHSCGLDFLACWSRRWCPPNHRVWVKNVRYFLDR